MGNSFSKRDRNDRRYSWDENVDTVLLNFFNFLKYSDKKFLAKKPSHHLVTQALKENFRWEGHGPEKINIIHYAAAKASVDGVQYIIKAGADVNRKTKGGLTALHFAVVFKNFKVIETLVAFGADTNAQASHNGYTPLHYACRDKDILTVKKLIRLGADGDVRGNAGEKPIDIARKLGSRDIVKVLLIHKEKFAEKEEDDVENDKPPITSGIPNGNIVSRTIVEEKKPIMTMTETKQTSDTFPYQEAVKIQENYETFLEYMTNTNDIINKLFTSKHITLRYKEYLQHKDEQGKNEELLSHVMKGDQEQYFVFISALKETGNSELANLLVPTMHAPVNLPQVVHVDFTQQAVSSVSTDALLHANSNKRILVSQQNDFPSINNIGYQNNVNIDHSSEVTQGHVSRVYINKTDSMSDRNTYHTKVPDENHNTIVSMQNVHTAGIEDNYNRNSGYAHRSMENIYPGGGVNYTLKTGNRGYRQTIGSAKQQNLLIPQSNQVRILNGAPGSQPVYVLRHHSVSSGNRKELESKQRSRDYDTVSSYTSVF